MTPEARSEVDELLAQIGIARADVDKLVEICEAAYMAGETSEQITARIHLWLDVELVRRGRLRRKETMH